MNILAIDTSGPVAGVCVLQNGRIICESAAISGRTHSESILPLAEEALTHAALAPRDIDLYAVVTGPGSFTGVRIGVSLVKGMAHGAGKGCIGVDALEALAACHAPSEYLLCPIQDARGGQVYGAIFEGSFPPKRLTEDSPIALDAFMKTAADLAGERKLLFTGDGVRPNKLAIVAALGDRAVLPPEHMCYLRPAAVAALAWENRENAVDYLKLMPVYLRPPQAVRLKERMEVAR